MTGVIIHGRGLYLYLADEGMPGGSNWSIECVTWNNVLLRPSLHSALLGSKAMRSIDHAWTKARACNESFPQELLN